MLANDHNDRRTWLDLATGLGVLVCLGLIVMILAAAKVMD